MKLSRSSVAALGIVTALIGIAPGVNAQSSRLTGCGAEDWNCFIQLAQTCTPAQIRGTATAVLFGLELTANGLYEMWRLPDNRCVLYARDSQVQGVRLSNIARAQALASGSSQEQIEAYERQLFSSLTQTPQEATSICRFSQVTDLVQYLQAVSGRGSYPADLGARVLPLTNPNSPAQRIRSYITLGNRDIAECDAQGAATPAQVPSS